VLAARRALRRVTAGAALGAAGLVAGFVAAADVAGAQGTPAAADRASAAGALADRRLVDGLDAATLAAVRAVVGDAARRQVPVEPLVARALAGVEMGAPPARVLAAVRALAGRLTAARDALAPAAGPAEVTAGADALAAGVPPAVLAEVRRLLPGRSAAVPLGVLAQLVARGVPPARAAAAVTTLVRRGARSAQLVALDAAVQADVAAGWTAATALDGRARELADGGRLSAGPLVPPLSTAPGAGVADVLQGVDAPSLGGPTRTNTNGGSTPAPTPPRLPPRRP
jgi:hypothetical protein